VEGIRPVLPLIRNTPYGKRIQNKLQREHMDTHSYGGGNNGYSHHNGSGIGAGMGGMGYNNLGNGGRQMHQSNSLNDVYGSQPGGVYSLGQGSGLGQHLSATGMHGIHSHSASSIDPYILQSGGQGLPHSQSAGFSTLGSFGNQNAFANGGLTSSLNHPPYGRNAFPYGM
jgi:hypothetical protein